MGKRSIVKYVGGKKEHITRTGCGSCGQVSGTSSRVFSSINEEIIPIPQNDGRVLNMRFKIGQVGSYDEDTVQYLLAYGKATIGGKESNRFEIIDGKI